MMSKPNLQFLNFCLSDYPKTKNLCKFFNGHFVNYVSSLKLFTFDWKLMIEGRLRHQCSYHKMLNSNTNDNAYDYEINISDKKSRRFDLSEVIFKCIKVL